jgi:hypothetical protein
MSRDRYLPLPLQPPLGRSLPSSLRRARKRPLGSTSKKKICIDKIVIRSNDQGLLKKTWSINSKDDLEPSVINEIRADGFAELTIFPKEQFSTLPFVIGLLEFMEARTRLTGSHSRVEFHITSYTVRFHEVIAAYYDRIEIEVHIGKTRTPQTTDER